MATITLEIDSDEMWGALWGSGFESDPVSRNWLMTYEYIEGNWDKAGVTRVYYIPEDGDCDDPKYWDEDEYKQHCHTKDLTLADLERALSYAMKEGYNHVPCGGKIDTNTDNWDSCVADILLQIMVYGKEVYA